MHDRTRQHASSTTDHHRRRPRALTARGLVATVLLAATVPALAWLVAHPATAATLAVGAALPGVVRFLRARVTARSTTLRATVGAASAPAGDRE